MLKSRLFRSAVNLCVTGALLVPVGGPGAVFGDTCGRDASSEATCEGCGHCSVNHRGDRCSCCSKKPLHHKPGRESSEVERATEADTTPSNGCGSHPAAVARRAPQEAAKADSEETSSEGWGVCLCSRNSQPAVPAPLNRSAVEQLVQLINWASVFDFGAADLPPFALTAKQPSASLTLLPRDSQRRLCVWRI